MTAHEVWDFAVTIPAGTPITAPVTVATAFPPRTVTEIHWRVPRGSLGVMGWRITSAKAQIIPRQAGGWMIHDGQSGVWPLENMPDSGAWEVTGYNTGTQPHTVYVTYLARVIQKPSALLTPLTFIDLAEVPDLSQAGAPVGGQ
jgi:hypothetical protein